MADAAQRAIQLAIVWFLKKRRAKKARMIEEKRASFLYIHNRQHRYYFGQLLLACINQPLLRTIWMNPREATWFEMVTDTFNNEQWYQNFRFLPDTEASDLSDDAILFLEEHVRIRRPIFRRAETASPNLVPRAIRGVARGLPWGRGCASPGCLGRLGPLKFWARGPMNFAFTLQN